MPGVDDPERVKKLIGSESNLALMKVAAEYFPDISDRRSGEAIARRTGSAEPQNSARIPKRDDTVTTPTNRRKNRNNLSFWNIRRSLTAANCATLRLIRRRAATAIIKSI